MFPRSLLPYGIIALACAVSPAAAQDDVAPPAHVSWVEGQVLIEREATREDLTGPTPLLPGERVRTDSGRAEVLFGDGTLLQLDERTTIDVLSDALVRLIEGRVMLVVGSGGAGRVQVDTPGGSVEAQTGGEYRIAVLHEGDTPMLEVAAIRGSAEVFTDQGTTTIAAGERAWAREGELPSHPAPFNSARWDAFDQWSQQRLSARRGVYSASHVPPALHSYAGVLDTHGYWAHEPTYGQVWYPRVAPGWRPYYHGRWRYYARFGWTWLGADVWAWPTHHYGRWGVKAGGAWFWIPGRQWGPAWVHWAVAPGYVSWCPLGYDNRPVFAFWRAGHRSWGHTRWSAWTVVPRRHFGGFVTVNRHALDGRHFSSRGTTPAFIVQARSPGRSFAVAREAFVGEPRVAVRRGGSRPAAPVGSGRDPSSRAAVAAGRSQQDTAVRGRTPGVRANTGLRTAPAARGPARSGRVTAGEWDARGAGAPPSAVRRPSAAAPAGSRSASVRTTAPGRSATMSTGAGDAAVPARRRVRPSPTATTPPAVSTRPAATPPDAMSVPRRGATPRTSAQPRVWSPDQVPVHRGTPPRGRSPERTDAPARGAPDGETSRPRSYGAGGSRAATPPARTPGARGAAGREPAAPSSYGSPGRRGSPSASPPPSQGERRVSPRSGGSGGGSSRAAAPPPSSSGRPASAAPARGGGSRQAPGGGGRGSAVPRGRGGSPR